MKKIIFINRYFYPDQSATSQLLSDLLFNIAGDVKGDIHVVTSRNTYECDKTLSKFELINNIKVHRVLTTNFGRANLIGRALDYLSFYFSTLFLLFYLMKKNDVVIAKTDPPLISFIAYIVVKLKKGHLVNWLQDVFPEVAGALGVINKNTLLYKVLNKAKNISLKAADKNIVIGQKMAEHLIEQGVDSSKVEVIHNWSINTDTQYVPKEENVLIDDWALNDKFVVGYSGNFGRAHEYNIIEKLVDNYKQDSSLNFLFIGGGKYCVDIKKYAEKNKIKNITFKPYQDKAKLNYSFSIADLNIISLRPELEGFIVPSKFYGLASIGVPILFIGDQQGEIAQIIKQHQCGYTFSQDQKEDICQLIDKLKSGEKNSNLVIENLKSLYETTYRPEVAYGKWKIILDDYVNA